MASYVIGDDFGTESGRAVVIDARDGRELGSSVYPYANGVIDETLPAPDDDVRLAPEWALQDPDDYIRTFQQAVPAAIAAAGIDAADVVGVGTDFTACTMLPTKADGTPLASIDAYRRQPHAWVKLWKHHAAQPEADLINATARDRGEPWLDNYGGKISSEWFYSKALQILDEAPDVYVGADRLIEGLTETLGIDVGGVTEDMKFSLETVRCTGCCALAPVLKVGEQVYARVRPKDLSPILGDF